MDDPELRGLFEANRAWAASMVESDPGFFAGLVDVQRPSYLWIGCADSRVPANEIIGLPPGMVFVHRNVANQVAKGDVNCLAVLQYALEVLQIRHVIVTGHYGCGGVGAALGPPLEGPLESWLEPLRELAAAHRRELEAEDDDGRRVDRLCELNVAAQVERVCTTAFARAAWERGQPLAVHGWIYRLNDGLLHDLEVTRTSP